MESSVILIFGVFTWFKVSVSPYTTEKFMIPRSIFSGFSPKIFHSPRIQAADWFCTMAVSRIFVFCSVTFAFSAFIDVNSSPVEYKLDPFFMHTAASNPGCVTRVDSVLAILFSSHKAGYSFSLSLPLIVLLSICTSHLTACMVLPSPVWRVLFFILKSAWSNISLQSWKTQLSSSSLLFST